MSDQKHLTLEGRIAIEKGLDNSLSFKAIALSVDKDCTTISKEVRNHLVYEKTGSYGRPFNDCLHRKGCPLTGVCAVCTKKRHADCCFCGKCTSRCPDYEKESCSRLQKPPYVCNGCQDRNKCTLEKTFYRAALAEKEYRDFLSEARSGPDVTKEELAAMNRVISPLIRNGRDDLNGKSPYEVFAFLYGEDILKKLGIRLIPADKIVLKPSLLKGGSHEDS